MAIVTGKQKLQEQLQAHNEGKIKETPESKELNRLRKKKENLEQGKVTQKGEKPSNNFTPDEQKEYDQ